MASPLKARTGSAAGREHRSPPRTSRATPTDQPQQQQHVMIRPISSNHKDSHPESSGSKNILQKSKHCHNLYGVFEQKLKEHFEEDYRAADWMPKATGNDPNSVWIVQAKSKGDPKNPQTVVSMTTSTRKERRADNLTLYDVKTVTKLLKLNGTVQKFSETSTVDEEVVRVVHAHTITITRGQALSMQRIKLNKS